MTELKYQHGGKRQNAGRRGAQINIERVLARLAQGQTRTEIAAAFGVELWIITYALKRYEFKIKIANDMKIGNIESVEP